jgi:hypothetical protein
VTVNWSEGTVDRGGRNAKDNSIRAQPINWCGVGSESVMVPVQIMF